MSANTICWTDIPVKDLQRAITFYSAVLDKEVSHETMPGFDIGLLPHAERNASGCLYLAEDNEPSMKGPLVYLSVDGRLDGAVEAARSKGGRVLLEKEAIGPYGFRAIIADSEGNRIALHSETA